MFGHIVGFYRVNYDDTNWKLISKALQSRVTDIHVINRAQLLDDSFILAYAGQLNYEMALELAEYLPQETEYVAWSAALRAIFPLSLRMNFNLETRELFEVSSDHIIIFYLQ